MGIAEGTGQYTAEVTTVETDDGNVLLVTGNGRLNALLLTTDAGGLITIYDGLTDTGTKIGYVAATTVAGTFIAYDIPYAIGICIHQATAPTVMTVVYSRS